LTENLFKPHALGRNSLTQTLEWNFGWSGEAKRLSGALSEHPIPARRYPSAAWKVVLVGYVILGLGQGGACHRFSSNRLVEQHVSPSPVDFIHSSVHYFGAAQRLDDPNFIQPVLILAGSDVTPQAEVLFTKVYGGAINPKCTQQSKDN